MGKGQGARGKTALGVVLGLLAATPLFAQGTPANAFDSRWTPYLGCWQIAEEHLGAQAVPAAPGLMVCVQPSGSSGVTITTTVEGKNVLEQRVVADGAAQPVSQADCQGTQTSQWSRDGERLFTRVELACSGRPTRVVSGITQLARGYWIEAQATMFDGDHDVRLRRYRRTSDQRLGGAAPAGDATGLMSIEDVIEASAKVLAPALEAALVETGGRFTLDSRALRQLADAGVSPNVIDIMVAQAYPDRFQVERPSVYPPLSSGGSVWGGGSTSVFGGTSVFAGAAAYPYPYPAYDPFYNSYYFYSPFAYPYYWGSSYDPYRYGYRTYYNNYYYGGYGGSVYGSTTRGSGRPAQPGSPNSPGGDGVVVKGRGYTRVRPSSESSGSTDTAAPAQRTGGGSGRTVRGGSDSSSDSSSSSSSSSSPSSGSSGGSTSGGSGRTAQPR